MTPAPKPKRKSTVQPRDARVASNAARAAAIFGTQSSIFTGRAKVTTLGLQRGVSEMIRRVYSTVPGVAPMKVEAPSIKVTYIGEQACAKYDWGRTAGKLAVAGVINLPACGEPDALIPRSVADQYTGYALHEMSHFLFTPLHAFGHAISDAARRFNVSQDYAKSIINALEDVAIERDLIRSGYAPGAGAMLRGLVERCIADVPRSAHGTIKAFPVTLAFGLRGYTPDARPLIAALPPQLRAIYDAAAHDMAALPQRAIGDGTAMQGVLDIAFRVLAALAALREAQPPQDEPGDGEPGDGEPGDGEPGDGEPGDGEPGDGEPGDGEPGDGEPGDGEPGDGEPGDGEPGDGEPGDGEPGDGEPGDGEPGDGEPGDVGEEGDTRKPGDTLPRNPDLPDDATPDPVEPRSDDSDDSDDSEENTPSKDEGGEERPDGFDTRELNETPLDGDMQPEQAGEPGDGASGLANDAVREVRANEPGAWDVESVAKDVAQALTASAKVAHGLRTLLDTSARDTREGGRKNGRLDMGALSRIATGAGNVFEKRMYRDGSDAAVTILIDQSSSMNMDQRYVAARTLAGTLSKIISGCAGVQHEILGFHSGGGAGVDNATLDQLIADVGSDSDGDMWRSLKGDCCITVFKSFRESHAHAMHRLGSCYGTGGTPDAAAITHAAKRLAKETADQHILIVIADGKGSPRDVLSRIVSRIEREGMMLIAIGIEEDMNEAFTHRARVDDIRKLNESGLSALLRALSQGALASSIKAGND